MSELGLKALACLQMATRPADDPERERLYDEASATWSEKAVCAMFESLVSRGYIECGVSARTGWITPRGRIAMGEADDPMN